MMLVHGGEIVYGEQMKRLSFRWLMVTAALSIGFMVARQPHLVVLPAPRAALAALNGDREHFACLYGVRVLRTVVVVRAAPAPSALRSGRAWAIEVTCEDSRVVGLAHNHPEVGALGEGFGEIGDPRRCWFRFPGTYVATADEVAFRASGLPVSVIVCGDHLVWEEQ